MSFSRNVFCAAVMSALSASSLGASTNQVTVITGTNNGVTTKYYQSCSDIAYKNAYKNAQGSKASADDYAGITCLKDGKAVACNEIYEDGQTESAKTDYFISTLPNGQACVSLASSKKLYDSTIMSCEDIAYKNAYCAISETTCDTSSYKCFTDKKESACSVLTSDSATAKAEAAYQQANADCNASCTFGGKLSKGNCVCEKWAEANVRFGRTHRHSKHPPSTTTYFSGGATFGNYHIAFKTYTTHTGGFVGTEVRITPQPSSKESLTMIVDGTSYTLGRYSCYMEYCLFRTSEKIFAGDNSGESTSSYHLIRVKE